MFLDIVLPRTNPCRLRVLREDRPKPCSLAMLEASKLAPSVRVDLAST
jgi:hypothetical protein